MLKQVCEILIESSTRFFTDESAKRRYDVVMKNMGTGSGHSSDSCATLGRLLNHSVRQCLHPQTGTVKQHWLHRVVRRAKEQIYRKVSPRCPVCNKSLQNMNYATHRVNLLKENPVEEGLFGLGFPSS